MKCLKYAVVLGLLMLFSACGDETSGTTTRADDSDQDGIVSAEDCDDNDPNVGSRAADADCDGVGTQEDCDDDNASVGTNADDADCDGVSTQDDCDDNDSTIGPNADDADCDGVSTQDDCDDNDSAIGSNADDADCDGVSTQDDCDDADSSAGSIADDADCDGVSTVDDCDDSDLAIGSNADDADCDGVSTQDDCDDNDQSLGDSVADADCDGVLTAADCDDNDSNLAALLEDADCDGALTAADCDDNDASLGALMDDADCDGVLTAEDCDDNNTSLGAIANDGDCDQVLTADDCDDSDASLGALVDDADCDGVLTAEDCDDNNTSLGAIANDGDCDQVLTADDCDDSDATLGPIANDADCDGVLTADDCVDTDPNIDELFECPEICDDHIDNNGDFATDCADSTCADQLICAVPGCVAPAAAPLPLPADFGLPSGMVLWLKSDRGLALSNGDVCWWEDQSGMNNHVSQTDATGRPVKAVLGTNDVVDSTSGSLFRADALGISPVAGRTFIAVAALSNLTARGQFLFQHNPGDSGAAALGFDHNTFGTQGQRYGSYATWNDYDSEVRTSTARAIHVLRYEPNDPNVADFDPRVVMSYRIDGAETHFDTTSAGSNTHTMGPVNNISRTTVGLGSGGSLMEIIAYDRRLTDAEVVQVEAALLTQFGADPLCPATLDWRTYVDYESMSLTEELPVNGGPIAMAITGDTGRLTTLDDSTTLRAGRSGEASLQFGVDFATVSESVTIEVDFSMLPGSAVDNLSFDLFDVDMAGDGTWRDAVRVTGYAGQVALNPVFTTTAYQSAIDTTALEGATGDAAANLEDGTVNVAFSSSVDHVTIEFFEGSAAAADPAAQSIGIGDFSFEPAACNP